MTEVEEDSMFDQWGGGMRELCERGFCCYTPEETKRFALSPPFEPMEEGEALLEQTRRYFKSFGPATLRDAAYFFGAPQRELRKL